MAFTLQPATGKDFINRQSLIREMVVTLKTVRSHVGFALIGTRRMGKTSVLQETSRLLNKNNRTISVYFSLWELVEPSLEYFSKHLALRILEAYKPHLSIKYRLKHLLNVPISKLADFLKSADIHIKLFEELEIMLSRKKATLDYGDLIQKVFQLSDDLAGQTNTKCIIMLDEFPSIIELSRQDGGQIGIGILRQIRSLMERFKHTVLCISGSIRKTMALTVLDSTSPFYRQFVVKNIGPFEKKDVRLLLERNLKTNLSNEVIETIYQLISGIPFYIQAIGRSLQSARIANITPAKIDDVFRDFLREEGGLLFREEFNNLSAKEKRIIYTMAKNEINRLGEIGKEINTGLNIVGRYLEYLSDKGIIIKEERGSYRLTDPVFARWIKDNIE